jgi:hypothetical protein
MVHITYKKSKIQNRVPGPKECHFGLLFMFRIPPLHSLGLPFSPRTLGFQCDVSNNHVNNTPNSPKNESFSCFSHFGVLIITTESPREKNWHFLACLGPWSVILAPFSTSPSHLLSPLGLPFCLLKLTKYFFV